MNQADVDRENDERILCKYGSSCYQKNKAHHEKYKHPTRDDQPERKEKEQIKKPTGGNSVLKQQKLNFFFRKKDPIIDKKETSNSEREEENEEVGEEKNIPSPSSSTNTKKEECKHVEENEISPSSSANTTNEDSEDYNELGNCEISSSCSDVTEEDSKTIIKKLFLVDMPEDFYSFWSFCKNLSPKNPRDALNSIDLTLVGPYDVLAGILKEDSVNSSEALIHWRYYYDPPEFQTIMKSSKDGFHIGYFRDDPNMSPVFLACNSAKKNALITPIAENIFGAVDWYLNQSEKASNPFKKVKSSNLRSTLHDWAKKYNFSLEKYSKNMQKRNKLMVCKTFQQVGVIVPYDKKTQVGYRPLSEDSKNLKKILEPIVNAKTTEECTASFNSLYSVVNWANIAMDEGDFGTNLELGLNLFSYKTNRFNSIIRSCLETAYNLLDRKQFATIIKAHLDDRREGDDLSVIKNRKK